MKRYLLFGFIGSLSLLVGIGTSRAAAIVIQPDPATGATATSTYGDTNISKTLDYSGLSVTTGLGTGDPVPALWPTDASTGHTNADWLSNATQNVTVTYNLGAVYTLGDGVNSMHIYNYNEGADVDVNPTGFDRGVQTTDIFYAGSDGVFHQLGSSSFTFLPGTGLDDYRGSDYNYLNGVTAQYVRFAISSNYSNLDPIQGDYTGLSEVRFIGALTVPEPSTLTLLLGTGGAALVSCLLRRRSG